MNAVIKPGADTATRAIDHALSRWIRARTGSDVLARAAHAASAAEGAGHACARLDSIELEAPFSAADIAELRAHAWAGAGAAFTPFVLDAHSRFYSWRTWQHETQLAGGILERCGHRAMPIPADALVSDLDALFGTDDALKTQWQRAAVAAVAGAHLFVLTGGPGTGKTTTVVRMLLMLLRHARACGFVENPSIALAAPTGKAAQRLAQAIAKGKDDLRQRLPADSPFRALLESIPHGESRTLHRLLGFRPRDNTFSHGASDPVAADIVVVDEASMADLAMMRQLVDALRPGALLILLGDPDQLASVDAGSVLADVVACAAQNQLPPALAACIAPVLPEPPPTCAGNPPLAGHVITLTHIWRAEDGLKRGIQALRDNDQAWLDGFIERGVDGDLQLLDCATPAALGPRVEAWIAEHAALFAALMAPDIAPRTALQSLREAQILCALRDGRFGAQGINELMTLRLAAHYHFDPLPWYHGRPVIITRNDYARGLFNGDVGIALHGQGGLRVWFQISERDGSFGLRSFSPRALPAHETAWAITIHRSQGSEYADVAVLLPPDADNRILTRELVYTAVSRAKRQAQVWSSAASFRAAVARPIQRHGGLRDRLGIGVAT